ncbi:hypothetical protein E2P81_ATG04608 [Venturia nashicola]|nr:hypothetical protein E2P81_ATG04608 [Venturia nashicola]
MDSTGTRQGLDRNSTGTRQGLDMDSIDMEVPAWCLLCRTGLAGFSTLWYKPEMLRVAGPNPKHIYDLQSAYGTRRPSSLPSTRRPW